MFKLVVLSAVLAVASAAPSATLVASPLAYTSVVHQPALVAHKEISYQKSVIEEPTVAHVGTVVKNVPSGVTHHSSSVVHHDAKISEPVFATGVKKTVVATPVEKTTYHQTYAAAPAVAYAAPAVQTHYVEAAPAVQTHYVQAAPALKAHYVEAAPALKAHYVEAAPALTYAAAPAYAYAAAPLAKAHYVEAAPALTYASYQPALTYAHAPAVYAKH